MADEKEEVKEQTEEGTDEKNGKGNKKASEDSSGKSSLLAWVLIAMIVVVCSAGGGIAANIFMSSPPATDPTDEITKAGEEILGEEPEDSRIQKEFDYYPFEPLTVNLDVQRQNRYIRITVVLAISQDDDKSTELLDKKKVELTNWIMTYMAGHTLEQVAGRKNMVRIQREIGEALNEQLWPNQKPRINHVLFKDYAVQ